MAKIQCYNCKQITPVVAPNYRCKIWNYPLNKYVHTEKEEKPEEIIIEKPKLPEEDKSVIDALKNDKEIKEAVKDVPDSLKEIKDMLTKLKADERVQRTPTGPVIVKKNLNPEKSGKIVGGWLVVHTENKLPVTYELFEGSNLIGRPEGQHVDVRIEDDEYVSRVHAVIRIFKDFLHRFRCELADDGTARNGQPSTNGCYVNGNATRLTKDKVVFLRDGDTIQIGLTKLVFKSTDIADDLSSAANSVKNSDFTHTISIRR